MPDKDKPTDVSDEDLNISAGEGGPGAIDAFRLSDVGGLGKPVDLKVTPQIIDDDVAGRFASGKGPLKK